MKTEAINREDRIEVIRSFLYTRKPRVRRVVQKRLSRRGGKKNSFCFEIVVVSYNQKQKEVTHKKMNDK